ncbi:MULTISPECIES: phage head-tail connector protein [unclassified Roseitalea]|uniref:head-tail connector protein n=1 Tax=unclassified Roseitalea TaxID=2639107 RepID=UPI00273D551B|nr:MULTISPECIES: phage head-tail connector protein [unclassified Roseitalea]
MVLSLLVPPAAPPVTLADAKAHLRVTHDGEDTQIAELVDAAAAFVAEDAGVALVNQTWRLSVGDPPDGPVCLPRHPVAAIAAVTVYDADGNPAVLDGAQYTLDVMRRPARLGLEPGAVPSRSNGIEIDFVAGFGDTGADVPDTLRRAVLCLLAHWYEFRGVYSARDQPVSVPMIYARLTRSWRRIGV